MDTADVTDATWEREVLAQPGVVIVEVHTRRSGTCGGFAPTVRRFVEGHPGSIALRRLERATSPSTAERYAVTSVPTLLVFQDGRLSARLVGARQPERLVRDLAPLLG